ncbi:MAG: GNAT family N-acetyltransferase [Syntrophobacteraceae bacterium]|jgi:GNAT superfamily N-acetyltransferase|nr:GNAT family N-acetyltransferase [Syntrophobacteraceae bacterium]
MPHETPQGYSSVRKIELDHDTDPFDCGRSELNRFLKRFALVNQKANTAQTYVVCRGKTVVGYYSLTVGSAAYQEAPERIVKGLARHPVPPMILARLAVDLSEQGRGLGAALLKDAMLRTNRAADIAGIWAFFVHAKDDEAKRFHEHFDFKASPTDPHHLYCLIKDIRRIIGS